MDLIKKLALAEHTARTAGALLLSRKDFKVEHKAKNDYVTEMDTASERLIRDMLLAACPEDGFYGEESGGNESGTGGRWIVDPIDGTTNFIRGIAIYSISIAYQLNGELVLGCVYAPVLDEMYLAAKGHGATLNGHQITVTDTADPGDSLVGVAFAHRNAKDHERMLKLFYELSELGDMRRLGSAAYDLCAVASGKVEAFMELGLHLYDIAAGIVIVREAGGSVTGWPDEEHCEITGNVLAGNGRLNKYLEDCILRVPSCFS